MNNIKVYHNTKIDEYFVVLPNGSVFEMSANADQPNGVNLYVGERKEVDVDFFVKAKGLVDKSSNKNLPIGLLNGIIQRYKQKEIT